jgi:hypothetical protein
LSCKEQNSTFNGWPLFQEGFPNAYQDEVNQTQRPDAAGHPQLPLSVSLFTKVSQMPIRMR